MDSITVAQFLKKLPADRLSPVVESGSTLEDVVRAMVRGYGRRVVYITDTEGALVGGITLNYLKNLILRYSLGNSMGDSGVLTEKVAEVFWCEKAADCMETDIPVCRRHEPLSSAIDRMLEYDTTDIPVVDRNNRILASIDILDIMHLWLRGGMD